MKLPIFFHRVPVSGAHWLPALGIVIVVILHLKETLPFQDFLRAHSFDLYQKAAPRTRLSSPVLIVSIDEKSLERWGQWPWPRALLAKLLDYVWHHEPAAVGFDLLMPERDRTSPCDILRHVSQAGERLRQEVCKLSQNDELLAKSLARGKAVLGVAGVDHQTSGVLRAPPVRYQGTEPRDDVRHFEGALINFEPLEAVASGHAILSADLQFGAVRRFPMIASVNHTLMPSLPLEMIRVATETPFVLVRGTTSGVLNVGFRDLSIPTNRDGSIWIRYGHHDPDRFVSAADVLEDKLPPHTLQGKLVLIGFTGLGLTDFHATALGERIPGVEIHAQVLENLFDGTHLQRPSWAPALEACMMLVIGTYVVWGFPRQRAKVLVPIIIVMTLVLSVLGFLLFEHAGLLVDVASPISIFLAAGLFTLADMHVRDELQRRRLEGALQAERDVVARARGEMEAARRIQMGTLPNIPVLFRSESRVDIAAVMEPAKLVGGDFYDCFMLDAHHLFLCVGDVCGKGVPASLFMVISKTLCKSLALRSAGETLEPSELMRLANHEISRDNAEMLFVTAFMAVLDLRTGEVRYSNAGHEKPFSVATEGGATQLEGAGGPPLCVVEDYPYESHTIQLSTRALLVVFTDGVTEAFNASEEMFGLDRLRELLGHVSPTAHADQILGEIRASVNRFTDGAEASDDFTAVALRWTSTSPSLGGP